VAQKKKASQKSETTVTRIKATDTSSAAISKAPKKKIADKAETVETKQKKVKKPSAKGIARPFVAFGGYFKGAWQELKQVRWPTRRATWGLTLAVLLYTLFFVVLVILLDIGFKYLFDIILGK
jgi:preprotein translocase, SecE subunit, bacterial